MRYGLTAMVTMVLVGLFASPGAAALKETALVHLWPESVLAEAGGKGEEKAETKGGVTRLSNVTDPTIAVYKPAEAADTGAAVIICPGGGYSILAWDLEGTEVAEWLNSIGATGVLLKYRVPGKRDLAFQVTGRQTSFDSRGAASIECGHG